MVSNLWGQYGWNYYRITTEAAIQIALRYVPGQVVQVKLEIEHGLLVYEVYIRTPYGIYEVNVDANSGRVVQIDLED